MPDLSQYGLDPYGTVDPTSGTFTPGGESVPAGSPPNPFIDAGPWGKVEISGLQLPGIVRSVDGAEKPEEWQVQKGTKESNATTTWKGTKLAESIKIVIALANATAFAGYYVLRDVLRPKIGEKPPAHVIANPIINFNGITRISIKNISPPKWQEAGAFWLGEIELLEYNPSKPANTGTPAAGKDDANADVKKELQKTLDEAAKL